MKLLLFTIPGNTFCDKVSKSIHEMDLDIEVTIIDVTKATKLKKQLKVKYAPTLIAVSDAKKPKELKRIYGVTILQDLPKFLK